MHHSAKMPRAFRTVAESMVRLVRAAGEHLSFTHNMRLMLLGVGCIKRVMREVRRLLPN